MPTKIQWTGETWNPVRARLRANPEKIGWHCTHKSDGCKLCYAEAFNRRLGTGLDYKPGHEKLIEIFLDEKALMKPLHWARPRLIFPGSMTDLFADFVTDEMLDRIFAVCALTPRHTYQFLTKRPDRMRDYFERMAQPSKHFSWVHDDDWDGAWTVLAQALEDGGIDHRGMQLEWPLPNVWLGTSVEDDRVRERIDVLRQIPAASRWLSIEPMIGRIPNIDLSGIDWVVLGGESGATARPMHPDWAREIRDACTAQGVAFFFKQWGAWVENWSPDLDGPSHFVAHDGRLIEIVSGMQFPAGAIPMRRTGKKTAGAVLDGQTHLAIPFREAA